MANIRLLIEYDGSAYAGWQFQANQPTVQGTIERALASMHGDRVTLYGAGRTDSGAHALGQVANFHVVSSIPTESYAPAIQQLIPADIVIRDSAPAPDHFHSRFSATKREYRYRIGTRRSALERLRRWELRAGATPDIAKLNAVAALFRGDMDCESFCIPGSRKENCICHISESEWEICGEELHFRIVANRFLHGMIRSIVALCVRHATDGPSGRVLTLEEARNIIEARTWPRNHAIAPAHGLYLVRVDYDKGADAALSPLRTPEVSLANMDGSMTNNDTEIDE